MLPKHLMGFPQSLLAFYDTGAVIKVSMLPKHLMGFPLRRWDMSQIRPLCRFNAS